MAEEAKGEMDLSEQIRKELERITRMQGITLDFDDDEEEDGQDGQEEEDEDAIHLTALVQDNALILNSSALPNDWGVGKEIFLNGVRFCPAARTPPPPPPLPLTDKTNLVPDPSTPSSRKSPRRAEKENEEPEEKALAALKRRKSQDLTALVGSTAEHTGFLAKLNRHGTYADRWCELDPTTKSFNYWKTRAARGVSAPTSLPVADILSVEWNAKDIKEGKRRNIIGMGGARFVITSKQGSTTWRAQDPLVTLRWITGIQDMLDQMEQPSIQIQESALALPEFERKTGMLQRMNAVGRYKDRWCELDARTKTLSYWAKKSHWETQAAPKGVVDCTKVTSIIWNPEDVRKGRRRSLLSKAGVRFSLIMADNSVQSWRTNNPLEASEWSRDLAAVRTQAEPQKA